VNPNYFYAENQVNNVQSAARSIGQEITILNASTIRDIDAAFERLIQMRADALLVTSRHFSIASHKL
jgi:DNA-binding LacI/PurR family transcriptional regulator